MSRTQNKRIKAGWLLLTRLIITFIFIDEN